MDGPILKRLLDQAADRVLPAAVLCNLTWRCPLRCGHCYVADTGDGGRAELSLAEYDDLFEQLAREGTFWLTLTGGDPLLRPDLVDIVAAARARHFAVRLFTSGVGLDADLAAALAAQHLSGVEISLQSPEPALHDGFTGRPGSWEEAVAAVRRFRALGVHVALKACVMDFNADALEALYKFAAREGCSFRHSAYVTVTNDGDRAPLRYRMRDDQLPAYYALFAHPAAEGGAPAPEACEGEVGPLPDHNQYVLSCCAALNSCAIDPYGDVWPCVSLPMFVLGSVRGTPFGDIWRGEEAARFRAFQGVPVPKCTTCDVAAFCARCPSNAALEEGDIAGVPAEQCRQARAFARACAPPLPKEEKK